MKLTGAQALIKALEMEHVETMFGLPGGCILPAYDPLLDSPDPSHPRAPRAGCGSHGRGLRPRHRSTRRGDGHQWSSGHQHGHPADGCLHGLDPDGVHHRSGGHDCDRHRCLPGVRHGRHHPQRHQAQRAGDVGPGHPDGDPSGVPHRHHRPSRPDPDRRAQGRAGRHRWTGTGRPTTRSSTACPATDPPPRATRA